MGKRHVFKLLIALAGVAVSVASPAKSRRPAVMLPQTKPVIDSLLGCRTIADSAPRLQCFDREAASLDSAIRTKDVAVVNRADVRKTRRTLFGIALPTIKLFANDDEEEVKEITAIIQSVSQDGTGHVIFTLDDGAVWAQTDDWPVIGAVKAGQKVTLKRGALGSYFADFEKAVPVRAKRLR